MTPTEALQALAQVLAPLVARELQKLPLDTRERPYSQLDGERPPGISRVTYLRAWKVAHEQGHPGATADGRARLLTAEAFAVGRAAARPPKKVDPVDTEVTDEVLKRYGLVRHSAA